MARRPTSIVNIAIRALDETKRGFSAPIKNLKDLRAGFAALRPAAVAAGAATAGAFALATKSLVDTRQALAEFSDRIGINIESLSQLKFAAEQSGVGFRELQTSLQRMTRRVGEGTAATQDALESLGLTLADLQGKSANEQFQAIARGFDGIDDAGQRAAIAMKLFDTEGVKLLQMLGNGSAGLQNMMQQADALGLTMTSKSARAVQTFNENLGQMKGALMGIVNQFLEGLLPSLNALGSDESMSMLQAIQKGFFKLGEVIGYAINILNSLRIAFIEVTLPAINFVLNKAQVYLFEFANFVNKIFEALVVTILKAIENSINGFLKAFDKIKDKLNQLPGVNIKTNKVQVDISSDAKDWFRSIQMDTRKYSDQAKASEIRATKGMEAVERSFVNLFFQGNAFKTERAAGQPISIPTKPKIDVPVDFNKQEKIGDSTTDGPLTFRPAIFSESFEQFIERYKQVIFDINNIQIELFSSMDRGMTDAFASIMDGSKSAGKAFQDMGKMMLSTIAQIISRLIVANILTRALGFFSFGSGNVAGLLGDFQSGAGVAGIAHKGLTNVPREGTFLLNKGERVIAPEQNEDLTQFLAGNNAVAPTEISINLDGEILARSMENLVDINVVNINASSVI